jgi:plastocyanin
MVRRLITRAAATLSALAISLVVGGATPAGAAGGAVSISSSGCGGPLFCYKPPSLTVTNNSAVTWTDSSHFPHTVTRCTTVACSGTGPGTGTDSTFTNKSVAPNGSASHTFNGTGTYNYYCTIHGYGVMHGSIMVTAPK